MTVNNNAVPKQAVLGGNGQLGKLIIKRLIANNIALININRSKGHIKHPLVTNICGDINNAQFVEKSCLHCEVVYLCASPAYADWPALFMPMIRSVIKGLENRKVKLIVADNLYMYGSHVAPLQETFNNNPLGPKAAVRAQVASFLMDQHNENGMSVSIARASDFFGPNISEALMGDNIFKAALEGKKALYVGNLDVLHSFTFIDDFADSMLLLANSPQAAGKIWHVPTSPAITPREFIKLVYQQAGKTCKINNIKGVLESLLSFVSPALKSIQETRYQRDKDFVVDSSLYKFHFIDHSTPVQQAISQTLAAYSTAE